MKNLALVFLFALLPFHGIFGQLSNEDVLFTVDDEPVYINEFKRVYKKNLDLVKDESQKDIDNYLDLYVNYKLKLKEAKALGLHEKAKYKKEFANYRKQLAKNYLTDTDVTEALVKEAYDRTVHEINASHILIRVPENGSAQDTLIAYNKLLKAKEEIQSGEEFAAVARRYSEDPTVQENGGNLGFFAGFGMVYDFENAAYNTEIGQVSDPFRTKFGFHIVKVNEKRKSLGKLTVAHIMVAKKKEGDTISENPEARIHDIYKKLQQGENFESLAKQFSEDKGSAKKGGRLNKFGKGQLSSSQFEEAAFALNEKGDFSEPVQSDFGWHVIQLIEKHPVSSYENMKRELESKIKRGTRSQLITTAFTDKLKKNYNLELNQQAVDYFAGLLDADFYNRTWKIPENINNTGVLNTIGKKTLTYGDFANHLVKAQRKMNSKKSFTEIINNIYNDYLSKEVVAYHEENLEEENDEFRIIVEEYRDGLLLFDLMEAEVWNAAKDDSLGLQKYFKQNSSKYIWKKRAVATVASSADKNVIKKVGKMLSKDSDTEKIKKSINKKGQLNVIFTSGTMDEGHQALPTNFQFNKGLSEIYQHNDGYVIVKVDDVIPSTPKTFEEAKGKVISDFQSNIEENWLNSLGEKYQVVINTEALNWVKKNIND